MDLLLLHPLDTSETNRVTNLDWETQLKQNNLPQAKFKALHLRHHQFQRLFCFKLPTVLKKSVLLFGKASILSSLLSNFSIHSVSFCVVGLPKLVAKLIIFLLNLFETTVEDFMVSFFLYWYSDLFSRSL